MHPSPEVGGGSPFRLRLRRRRIIPFCEPDAFGEEHLLNHAPTPHHWVDASSANAATAENAHHPFTHREHAIVGAADGAVRQKVTHEVTVCSRQCHEANRRQLQTGIGFTDPAQEHPVNIPSG